MKTLCIFGTRPEAIKTAPVLHALKQHPDKITTRVCVTGQHREMLDQMLHFFNIHADYDLNLMQKQQSLANLTSQTLLTLQNVIDDFKPDWILVQGDTTTAYASAMAAFYNKINVGHIEAGLRTYNLYSPWPEEANRRLISVLAAAHYAPTQLAVNNLLAENIPAANIINTGNTVIDALQWVATRIQQEPALQQQLTQEFNYLNPSKRLILVTGHRRENWDTGLSQVFHALKTIAQNSNVEIIYPVHLNPRVQEQAHRILQHQTNIFLVAPVSYISLIYLMQRCYLVVTDSGGIQEEAPSFGKPVLVTRNTTERPEAIAAGTAKLVGTDTQVIQQQITLLLDNEAEYAKMNTLHNPYGDGHASQRIVQDLLSKI